MKLVVRVQAMITIVLQCSLITAVQNVNIIQSQHDFELVKLTNNNLKCLGEIVTTKSLKKYFTASDADFSISICLN